MIGQQSASDTLIYKTFDYLKKNSTPGITINQSYNINFNFCSSFFHIVNTFEDSTPDRGSPMNASLEYLFCLFPPVLSLAGSLRNLKVKAVGLNDLPRVSKEIALCKKKLEKVK